MSQERTILARMYLNDGGAAWSAKTGWLGNGDHCTWEGVACSITNSVTGLALANNQLAGPYPDDLTGLSDLQSLNLSANALVGTIPDDLCSISNPSTNLNISGDGGNCPNDFDSITGVYLNGCCDNVLIDVDIYLNELAASEFGDANCNNLGGTETFVCSYMSNKANHAIFDNGYPEDLPGVWDWLKDRTILARLYLNGGGSTWALHTGWLENGNHCTWEGVTCSSSERVTELVLEKNQLSGSFPTDLNDLNSLKILNLSGNELVGITPADLCDRSLVTDLHISADSDNCPHEFDSTTGIYQAGCCDNIVVDVDIYLNEFASAVLGDANCDNLGGAEVNVCDYMKNKANHAIFSNGYPTDFPGVWDWLKERTILVRMYLNDGGSSWALNSGWLGNGDHCTWEGVICSPDRVTELALANNQMSGPFPSDLNGLSSLKILNLSGNELVGSTPTDICDRSLVADLHIYADSDNCPHEFDPTTGLYQAGCCDNVLIDVDIFLNEFTGAVLGDANCNNLVGTDASVCDYMSNKANHAIFADGYPEDFPGVWDWLKVSLTVIRKERLISR